MLIRIIKDVNRRLGYYYSPAQSIRYNGKSLYNTIFNFGFVPYDRIPYMNTAFNEGHSEKIQGRKVVWIEQISEKSRVDIFMENIEPLIRIQEEGSQSLATKPTFFPILLCNYAYYIIKHENSARISKAKSL